MIVVKLKNVKYKTEEREQNSKIIRKWFINMCIMNNEFKEKYYCIEDIQEVERK